MGKTIIWKKGPVEETNARCANSHGHFLYITYDERTKKWYKLIDHHYRGGVESLELAKKQLEREANGEGDAFGEK